MDKSIAEKPKIKPNQADLRLLAQELVSINDWNY